MDMLPLLRGALEPPFLLLLLSFLLSPPCSTLSHLSASRSFDYSPENSNDYIRILTLGLYRAFSGLIGGNTQKLSISGRPNTARVHPYFVNPLRASSRGLGRADSRDSPSKERFRRLVTQAIYSFRGSPVFVVSLRPTSEQRENRTPLYRRDYTRPLLRALKIFPVRGHVRVLEMAKFSLQKKEKEKRKTRLPQP